MQTIEATRLKHWNVLEYRRMTELGILNPDERTELISGQILFRAAKGTPHVLALRLLAVAVLFNLHSLDKPELLQRF
jgi:hypothetical protein